MNTIRKIATAGTLATLLIGGLAASPAHAESESRAIDGDSYNSYPLDTEVRIIGIDTPEVGHKCWDQARKYLDLLLAQGTEVISYDGGTDKYNRSLYSITIESSDIDSFDIGEKMIRAGFAIPRYDSTDGYGRHPQEAKYHRITPRTRRCHDNKREFFVAAAAAYDEDDHDRRKALLAVVAADKAWPNYDEKCEGGCRRAAFAVFDRHTDRNRAHTWFENDKRSHRKTPWEGPFTYKGDGQWEHEPTGHEGYFAETKVKCLTSCGDSDHYTGWGYASEDHPDGQHMANPTYREAYERELERQREASHSSSSSSSSSSGGYTGCRAYAPGGKTYTPIPCP